MVEDLQRCHYAGSTEEIFFSLFSSNSEADASELLENGEQNISLLLIKYS